MATATASKNTKADAKDDSLVTQETINRAALVMPELKKVEVTSGATKVTHSLSREAYAAMLDFEGVTVAEADKVAKANANIALALGYAVGETGLNVMKKHKDVEQVVVSLPATGRDRFEAKFDRSYQVPVMEKGADGKMVQNGRETRYGRLDVAFNTFGTRNVGQMSALREHFQGQALALLAKG